MNKINYLIIDDERLARQELRLLLKPFSEFNIIGEAANADEAITIISEKKPDLLFLDIQMPEKTGFDLLEELDDAPKVIFTTAYDQYAIRAFEVNALDYLLKPIRNERLQTTLKKIQSEIEKEKTAAPAIQPFSKDRQVFIKDGDQCFFVKISDIYHIESVGNYARLFFDNKKALLKRSLNLLDQKLDPTIFFRANRKEIINLQYIGKIEPMFKGTLRIYLNNGHKIEVSERRSAKFRELMSL